MCLVIILLYACAVNEANALCIIIIQLYLAPPPIVEITTGDDVALAEPVTLKCTATVTRDITSNLDFQWFVTTNGFFTRLVRSVTDIGSSNNNSVIYRDFLSLPALNASNRGDNYTCEVTISNSSISFLNSNTVSFELDFTSKNNIVALTVK